MSERPAPEVSVVVPVWDAYVASLADSVQSVLAQEGVAAEVIVVDNASATPVPDIAGTRTVRAPRRLTTGAARNLGLEAVRAPLVVFLDADDVLLPGALRALVAGIRASPAAVAYSMGIVDGDTGRRHRSPRRIALILAAAPRAFALATSVWSLLPTQGATIMPAAAVRAAGGYADRSMGEDWVLGAALAWRGRVRFDERPALVYRWRGDSPGRPAAAPDLMAGARAVRERLAAGPAPRAVAVIAAGQWLAIAALRPVVRGARSLARRG